MQEEKAIVAVQVFETVDAKVAADIQQFDVNKETIEKVKSEIEPLTINGIDDKAGAAAVWKGVTVAKEMRISVEKKRKELKEDSLQYGRKIDAYAKELTALIEPIEAAAKAKYEAWEAEKAAVKEAEEKAAQETLQARVKSIMLTGASFDGVNYKLREAEISHPELKLISENEFNLICIRFQQIGFKILEEKAEAERIEQQAEEQRQAEIKAEQERLAEQKRQQDEEAARLEAQRLEMAQQAIKLLEDQRQARTEQLLALGFRLDNGRFLIDFETWSSNIGGDTLDCHWLRWNEIYENAKKEVAFYRAEDENAQQVRKRTAEREVQLKALGMQLDGMRGEYYFKTQSFGDVTVGLHLILESDENKWGYLLSNIRVDINEIKQKQAEFDLKQQHAAEVLAKENEAKAEAERQSKWTDKEKLTNFIDSFVYPPVLPLLDSIAGKKIIDEYMQSVGEANRILRQSVFNL